MEEETEIGVERRREGERERERMRRCQASPRCTHAYPTLHSRAACSRAVRDREALGIRSPSPLSALQPIDRKLQIRASGNRACKALAALEKRATTLSPPPFPIYIHARAYTLYTRFAPAYARVFKYFKLASLFARLCARLCVRITIYARGYQEDLHDFAGLCVLHRIIYTLRRTRGAALSL